jgi:hypothetical protein
VTFKKGNKTGIGSNGQIRKDMTMMLISQLNEEMKKNNSSRRKIEWIVENLIWHAIHGGNTGHGDLEAIKEVWNRLEGRPAQRIVGADDGPVRIEYHSAADLRLILMERKGIDIANLPPVLPKLPLNNGDEDE